MRPSLLMLRPRRPRSQGVSRQTRGGSPTEQWRTTDPPDGEEDDHRQFGGYRHRTQLQFRVEQIR
jgi:hypothetical protein